MKKQFLLVLILLTFSGSVYSCGTVEGWCKYYFDHQGNEHEQLYALTLIQCQPVLVDRYKHTFEQDTMLFNIIEDALKKGMEYGNDCFMVNAIKIFILFGELKTLTTHEEYYGRYNAFKSRIENFVNIPIQDFPNLKLPYYYSSAEPKYCEKVKKELRWKK